MIHQLEIENFCSIRDKQILDLRIAENAPQLERFQQSNSRVEIRLPTVVGLFGANASGKSTVLRALTSTVLFQLHSFDLKADERIGLFQPFMGVEHRHMPTRLAMEFDAAWVGNRQHLYRYELHLDHTAEGFGAKRVSHEALFYSPEGRMRRLFERTGDQVIVGREFELRPKDSRLQSIRPNSSVLSTLAKLNHPLSLKIWQDLALTQSNLWEYAPAAEMSEAKLLQSYKNDPALLQRLSRELRRLDTGLEEMVIHEGPNGLFAAFIHEGLSSPLFLSQESRGTQHFIEMFPRIVYALTWGQIALIDELDADLHPLLLPEVFRWFHDPERNHHGAQLFFTAHNAGLMDYLEKEEIYFTEKNRQGGTELFGAADIQGLRREPSIGRKYLGGSLGAVPQVG
jgi:uncharacterized protein